MKKKQLLSFYMIFIISIFSVIEVLGQGKPYDGPDDPAGDIAAIREGYMTGNRVYLYFKNTTELSDWPRSDVSRWPNNSEGVKMLDGIALLIGARVYIKNDSIPVTNMAQIQNEPDLDTLYFLETNYREEMDMDPTGTVKWGLYPVFGYFNENDEHPAMSNIPSSWPPMGWPARGGTTKWPGEWNGRFGRGVIYADLETFFVTNDAQDQEYLGPEDRVKYYPRPGKFIQDDATIQPGKPWGGLGIRVETRGFQWNNPQARDCIFWEYNISNISDYDLPEVAFGYWVDNGIGGEADDELGYFDKYLDMAYSWDIDGIGRAGLKTGTMGFAYLESPGLPYDGIDNDDDGLIDEKRDNQATALVGPRDGIANLDKFLKYYSYTEDMLREHWDADEDQDWEDGEDVNGNGVYDITENPGDDVGLDGVGPGDLNYTGPDEGECNHKPDFKEGVGCEPNFAATDVSESDMVGLTAFRLFPVPSHASDYHWFRGDKSMWELVGSDTLEEYSGRISNLIEVFASGPFPLYKGRTERISMSILHSYDPLEGLNSEEHSAPALFQEKKIVQIIYEKDYRFAQPPKMPTLTATPSDGKVILTWDDIADKKTRDPFLGNVNDFEGYKIYRSTDPKFTDAEQITDGYGTPMFKKPIFQCDIKDGKTGFTDFGLVNGMGYYLGSDKGIVHYFVDENVQNGRTYYYAIVAYDYGAPNIGPGIAPSENNIVIELDEAENVISHGKNVAVVVPHQLAAGYTGPSVDTIKNDITLGDGTITPEIIAKDALNPDRVYKIKFGIDTIASINFYKHGLYYTTNSFYIYDENDTLLYSETPDNFKSDNILHDDSLGAYTLNPEKDIVTDLIDGFRLRIKLKSKTVTYDYENSGWIEGNAPITVVPSYSQAKYFPWDYRIVFTSDSKAYTGINTNKNIRDEFGMRVNRSQVLVNQDFSFYVINTTFMDSAGNYEKLDMVVVDKNENGVYDPLEDKVLVGPLNEAGQWAGTVMAISFENLSDVSQIPTEGEYRVTFKRPFFVTDSLLFKIKVSNGIDKSKINEEMDKIKVVPNPYVCTNSMERSVINPYLNQRRQIMFTHVPARCVIKIFTVSGVLVDEIHVNNSEDVGIAKWDVLTKEGLEVAAGMYIYHVKSLDTGYEKIGKFAIIK